MEGSGKGKGTLKPDRLTRAQAREAEAAGDADDDVDASAEPEEAGKRFLVHLHPLDAHFSQQTWLIWTHVPPQSQ